MKPELPEPLACPPDARRDGTLQRARERTERYSARAAAALEGTLADLAGLLEALAGTGPAVSEALVAAAKTRIDRFVEELAQQRAADDAAERLAERE